MPETTAANATGWFPVLTLALGFVTASIGEWIRDKRTAKREKLSREEKRRSDIYERKVNFQRETLLNLQEALLNLVRATGESYHQDSMIFKQTGVWQKQLLGAELDERYRLAQANISILTVRVKDEAVRTMVNQLRSLSVSTVSSSSEEAAAQAIKKGSEVMDTLNERIGVLLRELDDEAVS